MEAGNLHFNQHSCCLESNVIPGFFEKRNNATSRLFECSDRMSHKHKIYPVQKHVPLYTRKTISLPGNRQINLPVEIQTSLNDNATLLVLGKGGVHKI